jgi:hypothetical protein
MTQFPALYQENGSFNWQQRVTCSVKGERGRPAGGKGGGGDSGQQQEKATAQIPAWLLSEKMVMHPSSCRSVTLVFFVVLHQSLCTRVPFVVFVDEASQEPT